MKRLKSYGADLGSASGEKALDRSLSVAAGSVAASSSPHHRRWKLPENERGRSGAADDDRGRDMSRVSRRNRIDREIDDFDDREGSRGFRKRIEHDCGNDFDDREVFRNARKRTDHDLDGPDDRAVRGVRKRIDHDLPGSFDDREGSRGLRKRSEHDYDGFDRRNGFDHHRNYDEFQKGGFASSMASPRSGWGRERERDRYRERGRDGIRRSESFCVSGGVFPKGVRSERDRSKREDGVPSWRRFGSRSKGEGDGVLKTSASERAGNSSKSVGSDCGASSRGSFRSPSRSKDVKSPTWSKDSKESVELSKDVKRGESGVGKNGLSASTNEMEEGELQPDSLKESGSPSFSRKLVENVFVAENPMRLDLKEEITVEGHTVKQQNDSESAQNVKSAVRDSAGPAKLSIDEIAENTDGPATLEEEQCRQPEAAGDRIAHIQGRMCDSGSYYANSASSYVENNGDRPVISESLRNDNPKGSTPSSDELSHQAKEDVIDKELSGPIGKEKPVKGIDLDVGAENLMVPQVTKDVAIVSRATKDVGCDKELGSTGKDEPENGIDLEIVAEELTVPPVTKDVAIVSQVTDTVAQDSQRGPEPSLNIQKDKGKSVAICSSDEVGFAGKDSLVERDFIAIGVGSSQGTSIRGLDLFSCSAGFKNEKVEKTGHTKGKNEKINFGPLELSLGLPNVSVPAPSCSIPPPPNSPPHARSVQSLATTLRTGSDGFTTSFSFSGSQFIHNPSCSLTHNSVDYDCEKSVKSRPLFQGVDWQALARNDSLPGDLLAHQKAPSANGSLSLSSSSRGVFSSQLARGHATVGSQGTKSGHVKEYRQITGEGSGSRLFKSSSHRNMEQAATCESDFINNIVGLVASEPVQAMACKFLEMADDSIAFLKVGVQEIILKEDQKRKLHSLQGLLKSRSDLTLETLLKCHRVQLEILVAIKAGVPDFLHLGDSISSINLAEIFLNIKCRNPYCGSTLPVDECDCRLCSKKDGFCSMCMCLVCSKFDTASNTCSWVGCDVCSHWCHADCGLQKSYIRNGRGLNSVQGTSEMLFYCVACDHSSEMFGFVKDVFETCAAEWNIETMLKELENVKKIFNASNDSRGKQLHGMAIQLLVRIKSGSNIGEIYNQIMVFFNDCESRFAKASLSSGQELRTLLKNKETSRNTGNPIWFKTTPPSKGPFNAHNVGSSAGKRPIRDSDEIRKAGPSGEREPAPATPISDELESLVKIKLAEAKVFQSRAGDARREVDGLKHIAISKTRMIDEEYAARISSLQVAQVEETRRRKLEELQLLERSHREYTNMKMRMQEDVKELLLAMEDTKRS